MTVMLSFLFPGSYIVRKEPQGENVCSWACSPSMELALVNWARSVTRSAGILSHVSPSLCRRLIFSLDCLKKKNKTKKKNQQQKHKRVGEGVGGYTYPMDVSTTGPI